jgi:Methyltransferase domain
MALKGFSCCDPAIRIYRGIGNKLGGNRRATGKMPGYYFERVERNVHFCLKYGPPQQNDEVLELGTGWVHWEALTLRLFFDFRAVLYDVWDNRQLGALKSFVRQLEERFGQKGFLEGCDFDHARSVIKRIESARTFEELYEQLGFRYVLDPTGLMETVPRSRFRFAISAGVLEHISADTAATWISNMADSLVEGGIGIHGINISDHISMYDRSASPKQYLAYSESQWKRWCENSVQYINRIQRSDWLQMFRASGLSLLEEGGSYEKVPAPLIHPQYQRLSRKDIECTTLLVVVQKNATKTT